MPDRGNPSQASAPGGAIHPRRVLARLRQVMAGPGSAQDKLDRIVQIIAADLVAEVCSLYVLRPGEILELFATEGLRREAVRNTRLRVGEGIVGMVAAQASALNLADAAAHPAFAYRPETGEEAFASMLGVPVLRSGRVVGVLAVQNRARRQYSDDEVETLETVAMVLAELVAAGGLLPPEEIGTVEASAAMPRKFEGAALHGGLAIAPIIAHGVTEAPRDLVADDPQAELDRLETAVAGMHRALDAMLADQGLAKVGGESREVLETFRLIAADQGWIGRIAEAIRGGLIAEAAVERVRAETRARMRQITDAYIRERLADLEDLANRLLLQLAGRAGPEVLPPRFILAARRIGPAELIEYHARGLAGLVLEEGSPFTHAVIVARALDVPVVGGCRDLLQSLAPGDSAILDADEGRLLLHPEDEVRQIYERAAEHRRAERAAWADLRDLPARTRDGVPVTLLLNAGLLLDLEQLRITGADGIGLFRTEIGFMARGGFPDMETETAIYRRVADACGEKPVLFRTLDVGGDKLLPGISADSEENPALGWRSLRIGLDRPAVLRRQLRALLHATAGRTLRVMFPMVATVAELREARAQLDRERAQAEREGRAPERVLVGAMLEVPSLLWQLPALLKSVDFLSVGSNDLTQFIFAADRGNVALAERYDFLSAPMLNLLAELVSACNAAGVPLSLCGEAGARPLEALALLGIGFRAISMPPTGIFPVKAMLMTLDLAPFADFLRSARLSDSGGASLRGRIRAYARDHGIRV
ncbi:MAG: phosphoenolpyruvate--protein phosphotransferase [Alphaproteobacteria bacterium]|nr:phosphoenolpyruvate--protein phosphotransferase [Alphaproteobacteria bacterium]